MEKCFPYSLLSLPYAVILHKHCPLIMKQLLKITAVTFVRK